MVDGTYEITVDTPMGRQTGTVTLKQAGAKVAGEINAPIVGKMKVDGKAEGEDGFSAKGTLRVMLMKVAYELSGRVEGDKLLVSIHSDKGDMKIEGKRK